MLTYEEILKLRQQSLENNEGYWEKIANKLVWTKKWTKVFESSDENPFGKWFSGAELNLCFNCIDRHVLEGRGDNTAYVYESPVTQTRRDYKFSDVLDQVSRLAGVLTSMGVKKGDVVMVIMPSIPEGAFILLACARIGAFHATITGGLTCRDIKYRIDHCKPKCIVLSSHAYHADGWLNYKDEVDAACQIAKHKPDNILVFQRATQPAVTMLPGRDLDWKDEMMKASPVGCTSVGVNDPSFLVYTSGSTGDPKAVVHAGGIYLVRWIQESETLFGDYSDVFFSSFNFGWIAGVMTTYGVSVCGCAVLVFEGDSLLSEDLDVLYGTMERGKATRTFLRPGIWKIIKGKDPNGNKAAKYDLHRMNTVFLAGERTDIATMEWISKTFKSDVWNCYTQTEIACLLSGCTFREEGKAPSVHDYSVISPGFEIKLLTDEDEEAKAFELGKLLVKTGTSPWSFVTLLHDHETYLKKYFSEYPGYFNTMDQACLNDKGQLRIESRSDDMMKVGLHYVTSQAIEEVVMKHASVSECVVVSSTDLVWKEIPVTIFVKKPGNLQSVQEIEKEIHDAVQSVLGSTLKLGHLVEVKELPITRTGKLHRPSCKAMVRGTELSGLGNVENPGVLPAVQDALLKAGYGKNVLRD